jgi:hypothetical protein
MALPHSVPVLSSTTTARLIPLRAAHCASVVDALCAILTMQSRKEEAGSLTSKASSDPVRPRYRLRLGAANSLRPG